MTPQDLLVFLIGICLGVVGLSFRGDCDPMKNKEYVRPFPFSLICLGAAILGAQIGILL